MFQVSTAAWHRTATNLIVYFQTRVGSINPCVIPDIYHELGTKIVSVMGELFMD